jgi:3-phenylpropionate/trans-cinnamate dioxygenase ferredoxin reductase component
MTAIRTIVIVGAGLAGAKAAEALRKEGYDGRVVIVGEEPQPPYLRPPLSKEFLRGESAKLFVQPEAWYADQRIELSLSSPVTALDLASRAVVLDDGRRLSYDRLLLATGAAPRRLTIPGGELPGVYYLRTLADAEALRDAAAGASRVVVVGGGWVGAEVAASLRQIGLPVAMIVDGSVPFERVLGKEVGTVYADLHAQNGVELIVNQRSSTILGRGAVEAVQTVNGTRIEGDLVVVGVGAEPRTGLAVGAGIHVDAGIVVDEYLETSVPGVYAAGDVAAAWHPVFGTRLRLQHWDNARKQGRTAALNIIGGMDPYVRIPYLYSDQFDLGMEYTGYAPSWDQVVFRGDPASREFVAFWLKEGQVVAGMNANIWKVNDAIGALVASGQAVDTDRLVDPEVPLDDLEALLSGPRLATSSVRA